MLGLLQSQARAGISSTVAACPNSVTTVTSSISTGTNSPISRGGAVEQDDPVATRPPGELARAVERGTAAGLAEPLDEDLDRPAHEPTVVLPADPVLDGEQVVVAPLLDVLGDVVVEESVGLGADARAVFEDETVLEPRPFDQRHRLFERRLGLAAEADDEVARHRDAGDRLANPRSSCRRRGRPSTSASSASRPRRNRSAPGRGDSARRAAGRGRRRAGRRHVVGEVRDELEPFATPRSSWSRSSRSESLVRRSPSANR